MVLIVAFVMAVIQCTAKSYNLFLLQEKQIEPWNLCYLIDITLRITLIQMCKQSATELQYAAFLI